MATKVKRSTIGSLMQENVDLMVWIAQLYRRIEKLQAENELLIELIEIEEV